MTVSAKKTAETFIRAAVLDVDDDIPILFEDEEEPMGTANPHAWADYLLFGPLIEVLARRRPDHQVFKDLNCYYEVKGRRSPGTGRKPNFASDLMIVRPNVKLPFETKSYTIGVDGPQPVAAIEILSEETRGKIGTSRSSWHCTANSRSASTFSSISRANSWRKRSFSNVCRPAASGRT